MILVYDTETSGLVQNKLPHDHPLQPNLVQLGMVLVGHNEKEYATVEVIVRPEGYTIPDQAAAVHGITTEVATAVGVPLIVAVALFSNLRKLAKRVVAHNLPFDERVMMTAFHRCGRLDESPPDQQRTCTMDLATPVLNLSPTAKMLAAGYDKPKPPSLKECHLHFFREELVGAHGALVDARACARVYFEIMRGKT